MDLREITEFFRDFAGYIITIAVILIIFIFIVAPQPVSGNSMAPTLEDGDVTLVARFAYRIGNVKRNDIVIVKKNSKSFIKRVIGLPGEEIKYLNGLLYINDEPFKERFLSSDIETSNFLFIDICSEEDCPNGVIPENKYLVLGDNRPESMDSRTKEFGLVDIKEIKGKATFRIWPLNNMGKLN